MPRVRSKNPSLDSQGKRKPGRTLRQRAQPADVRTLASGSDQDAGEAGAGLILDAASTEAGSGSEAGAAGQEIGGPAPGLTFSAGLDAEANTLAASPADGEGVGQGDASKSPGGPPGASPELDLDTCILEARDILDFALDTLDPLLPSLAPIYTPDRRARIARAAGRLMVYYGYSGDDIITSPWAGLAIAVGPVAVPTYRAVRQDLAHWKAMRDQESQAKPPAVDPARPGPAGTQQPPPSNLHTKA